MAKILHFCLCTRLSTIITSVLTIGGPRKIWLWGDHPNFDFTEIFSLIQKNKRKVLSAVVIFCPLRHALT